MEKHITFEVVLDTESDKVQKTLAEALNALYKPVVGSMVVKLDGKSYDISRLRFQDADIARASLVSYLAEHQADALIHFFKDAAKYDVPILPEVYDDLTAFMSSIYPFAGRAEHVRLIGFIMRLERESDRAIKDHVLKYKLDDFKTQEQKRALSKHCLPDIALDDGLEGVNKWRDALGHNESMTQEGFGHSLSIHHLRCQSEEPYPIPIDEILEIASDLTANDLLNQIIDMSEKNATPITLLNEDWINHLTADEQCSELIDLYVEILLAKGIDNEASKLIQNKLKSRPENTGRRNTKQRI